MFRLREERVDDRNQMNEQKSREHTSHNGKFIATILVLSSSENPNKQYHRMKIGRRRFDVNKVTEMIWLYLFKNLKKRFIKWP